MAKSAPSCHSMGKDKGVTKTTRLGKNEDSDKYPATLFVISNNSQLKKNMPSDLHF